MPISCTLPTNKTITSSDAYPGTSTPWMMVRTTMYAAYAVAMVAPIPPKYVQSRSGAVLKLVRPSSAKFQSFQPENFELPAARGLRA